MNQQNLITFWPITSKLMDGFTHLCGSAWGTPYMLGILISIDKSKVYGHFK